MIAFVKDILIYLVIIVAVIYLPSKFGGWDAIFGAAEDKMAATNPVTGKPNGSFIPGDGQMWAYATLGLGSAMALFMYPHSITATPLVEEPQHDPSQRGDPAGVLVRARAARPARLGRDRGRHQADRPRRQAQRAARRPAAVRGLVPELVRRRRLRGDRDRRAGAGGDHVDRGGQHLHPQHLQGVAQADATPAQEAQVSKLVSLVVKAVALVFVLTLDKQNAINFQLLGGIWILQTFPAVVFSLYTRWFHRWALLAGWPVGMVYGTVAAYGVDQPRHQALRRLARPDPGDRDLGYIAMTAFVLNLLVAVVGSPCSTRSRSPTAATAPRPATTTPTPTTPGSPTTSARPADPGRPAGDRSRTILAETRASLPWWRQDHPERRRLNVHVRCRSGP